MLTPLTTNSISSVIGIGGGVTGGQPVTAMSGPSTGRFTGGVRFADPSLQLSFADPLKPEDFNGFMIDADSFSQPVQYDDWNNIISETPHYYTSKDSYIVSSSPKLVSPSAFDWKTYLSYEFPQYTKDSGVVSSSGALRIYKNGVEINDNTELSEREKRAYNVLRNPKAANIFDLQALPNVYNELRQSWYISPYGMGAKYGLGPKYNELTKIEEQYKVNSPGYIPMDFFAKHISDKLKDSGALTYGNIALATDILDAWRQQPALKSKFFSIDDFPSLWWGASTNTEARNRERAYIAEELSEGDSGGGLFGGGGFFGKLLSFAAPVLSFIPGLQPVGWALGALNAIANNNPLGALLSFAGPIMSSIGNSISNFSGVGDLGSGLTPPSDISLDVGMGGGTGLAAPADWGYSGFSPEALGSVSGLTTGADVVPGFSASDIGSGLSIPSVVSETFGTPLWQVAGNNLFGDKVVQNAVKGVLKLGANKLQQEDMLQNAKDRIEALREAYKKLKEPKPILIKPQGMQPASVNQVPPSVNDRWRRLRYGNVVFPGMQIG